MLIRVVLIGGALLLLAFTLRHRNQLADRIVGLALFVAAVAAILFPSITMIVANWFGVGRGTDLLLYPALLLFSFASVATFARMAELNRQVTLLAREIALMSARRPGELDRWISDRREH